MATALPCFRHDCANKKRDKGSYPVGMALKMLSRTAGTQRRLRFSRLCCMLLLLASASLPSFPQRSRQPVATPLLGTQAANQQNTYTNPVLPGDFSDLDAIRVGDDFYAISSTFQYSPGMVVLHSKDLVHWSYLGHVVQDITALDPELNYDRMGRAGRGIWAGSIREHAGRFFVYFGTPDQGIFMASAAHPAGPWTSPKLILADAGWDDPCPFWDEDGRAYLIATHFALEPSNGKTYNIHLFAMDPQGDALIAGRDHILHQSRGSEANKLYKIHGLYFHFFSEVRPEGRVVIMERAESLDGPWEERQVIHVHPKIDKEPNQGGLIELASGKWYFLSHQGTGDWEGRAGVLLPVTWIDGWPVMGRVGKDGIGNMVWTANAPIPFDGHTNGLAVSDNFDGPELKPAWEWNSQPNPGLWNLSDRPGFLRLFAAPALHADDLRTVPDILTQRALRSAHSTATVKIDLVGMQDGQQAGLMHYAQHMCALAVSRKGQTLVIGFASDNSYPAATPIAAKQVWLRSNWGWDGVGRFSYSTDGVGFFPIGTPCKAGWAFYRGDRIGIYTTGPSGYIDLDAFQYTSR
jgi:beta-xylosidase